jgi:hypothetical protein
MNTPRADARRALSRLKNRRLILDARHAEVCAELDHEIADAETLVAEIASRPTPAATAHLSIDLQGGRRHV